MLWVARSARRWLKGFGDAEVFSFHATKFFNTFEGGAITTNDDGLANRLSLMRNFGFAGHDHVIEIGTNGKMPEVSAAMGLTTFDHLAEMVDRNRDNYTRYRESLKDLPDLGFWAHPQGIATTTNTSRWRLPTPRP